MIPFNCSLWSLIHHACHLPCPVQEFHPNLTRLWWQAPNPLFTIEPTPEAIEGPRVLVLPVFHDGDSLFGTSTNVPNNNQSLPLPGERDTETIGVRHELGAGQRRHGAEEEDEVLLLSLVRIDRRTVYAHGAVGADRWLRSVRARRRALRDEELIGAQWRRKKRGW